MTRISIELTFNQLVAVIRRLPHKQKVALWRLLDAELKGDEEVLREFDAALAAIRAANRGVTEDEVMADVEQALREVRAGPPAARSG